MSSWKLYWDIIDPIVGECDTRIHRFITNEELDNITGETLYVTDNDNVHYQMIKCLGSGEGGGEVWEVINTVDNKKYALKFYTGESVPIKVEDISLEYKLLSELNHPSIVK